MMKIRNTHTKCIANFSLTLMLLTASPILNPLTAKAQKIYWTDTRGIHRADLDGTNVETPVPVNLSRPTGIALDVSGGKMYWADSQTRKIQRANLDGTNVEDIVTTGTYLPHYITVDASGGKIYWTDTRIIQRSNLDGTKVEDLVTEGLGWPRGIAVDTTEGKIYWADSDNKKIQYANLDGTEVKDFIILGDRHEQVSNPHGVAVDTIEGKVYWTGGKDFKIQRSNLDGTDVEDVMVVGTIQITVDVIGRKIYWIDFQSRTIRRANLDGAEVEDIITDVRSFGFAVDASNGKIYWTSSDDLPQIYRANLDGTAVEGLIKMELRFPIGLAIDGRGRKVYWTDPDFNRIERSDLDGTNIESLVKTGPCSPWAITVDGIGEKVYWTAGCKDIQPSNFEGRIYQSNLDGTDVEAIVTGLEVPQGIAVDTRRRKIYWSDHRTQKIQRSNLDGTHVEDLLTTRIPPAGIAVDAIHGKIYWAEVISETGFGTIQRSNLDGTHVENLGLGLISEPRSIAVDASEGKIYWRKWNPSMINRADLNGRNIEDIISGSPLHVPYFIALDLPPVEPLSANVESQGKQPTLWGQLRRNALLQNYPNPFNPETWMPFHLLREADVTIDIYDLNGQRVRRLSLGRLKAGSYEDPIQAAHWDGQSDTGEVVSSGVYFYRLQAGDYSAVRRMILLK